METFFAILDSARARAASDVHLKIGAPAVLRINGNLSTTDSLPLTAAWFDTVLATILTTNQHHLLTRDNEIDFAYTAEGIGRFRTNIFRQRGEWCIAMRRVNDKVPVIAEINLPSILEDLALTQRGIILIAGATGCGKSTTLAAVINHINHHRSEHVITLEDPIEYLFSDQQSRIEQREIGIDTASFQDGMRNILRQDPDVIMLGEMRDADSFTTAINSADTGHLVLSTLHTTTASQSITRILEFFKPDARDQVRRQLAATLRAVVCQRMLRTRDGGRIPAIEILINTPTVRKLLETGNIEKLPEVIQSGIGDGMQTFNQSLTKLCNTGVITEKEALANSDSPDALQMNLQGIILEEGKRILSR